MLCGERAYLAYVSKEFHKLRPNVERELEISLDRIVLKTMRMFNTDIRSLLVAEGYYLHDSLVRRRIRDAVVQGYYYKAFAFAAVYEGLRENVYINTYPHFRLTTSSLSIPDYTVHELYHLASMQIAPDLLERYEGNPESTKLRGALMEGFAHHFTFNVSNHEIRSNSMKRLKRWLERGPVMSIHAGGYRFLKQVCEQRGNDFALEVLRNPPQHYEEIRNPDLYLRRMARRN